MTIHSLDFFIGKDDVKISTIELLKRITRAQLSPRQYGLIDPKSDLAHGWDNGLRQTETFIMEMVLEIEKTQYEEDIRKIREKHQKQQENNSS